MSYSYDKTDKYLLAETTNAYKLSKELAYNNDCDLSVPNGRGLGNVLMVTRVVEELARAKGHPLKILTAPLNPVVGTVENEEPYPIWKYNPFIKEIINANEIDSEIIQIINSEKDEVCQFGHVIENICAGYDLRPRLIRPSIYLSHQEQIWAFKQLEHLPRPVVILHPFGKTSSKNYSKWYEEQWIQLVAELKETVSFVQLGLFGKEEKELNIFYPKTTIRQAFSLIWASDIFMGFDSSLAHTATAFEKPSFVLWDVILKEKVENQKSLGFGASFLLRWSYPQNKNVMILKENDNEITRLAIEFILENVQLFKRKI